MTNSDKTPAPSLGRFFLILSLFTFFAQLGGLQYRLDIFGTGTGWLTTLKYIEWGERLGLVALLLTFCLSTMSLYLLLWLGLGRLFKRNARRALVPISTLWITILVADFAIRQAVFTLLGDAFQLADMQAGVGGWSTMLSTLWSWYHTRIIKTLLMLIGIAASVYLGLRLLRSRGSWGLIDKLKVKVLASIAAVSTLLALIFLTFFAQSWPATRELLVGDTLVAWPMGTLVVSLTDFDGDGWSQFESPADSAPFDADCHPYALDKPGDGIDQDLVAGDLAPSQVPAQLKAELDQALDYPKPKFTIHPNVVLVFLESVRFDMLSAELEGRKVMPELSALVQNGALSAQHAYAAKGFTMASLTQAFWGGFYRPQSDLIDDFKANGYQILAFSGDNLQTEGFDVNLGLEKADLIYDPRDDPESGARFDTIPARLLIEAFDRALETEITEPYFSYIFLQDPHFPYNQDNPFVFSDERISRDQITPDNQEQVYAAYANQVFHVDKAIAQLVDSLKEHQQFESTTIIIMSDHGESLFDDGLLGHGTRINEVMNHGIFVVVNPRTDLPDPISHADLRPMLRRSLTQPTPKPSIQRLPQRALLHYQGPINSPSMIGRFSIDRGRLIYDFKRDLLFEEETGIKITLHDESKHEALVQEGIGLLQAWAYMQWINRDLQGWQ